MEHRRRRIALDLLGIPHGGPAAFRRTARLAAQVEGCRFDLWPTFLRRGLKRWGLIDVGANTGEFIRSVCALAPPGRIYAFEPLPEFKHDLDEIVSRHGGGKVIAAAAGERRGSITLNRTRNSKLSSVLEPEQSMHAHYRESMNVIERIDVAVTTVDAEIPPEAIVGLLKIDVQGFEPAVIDGARRTLTRTAAVMLEVNYAEHYAKSGHFEDAHGRLAGAGFRLYAVSCPHMSKGAPLWADAVYVNTGFERGEAGS